MQSFLGPLQSFAKFNWKVFPDVSCVLTLYVSQLVGIDISLHMVEVFNTCVSTQGLEPHEMQAVSLIAEVQQQCFDQLC